LIMVENLKHEGKVIARIIGAEELDGPFKFFTEDSDNLQISRWNHPRGYECKAHVHFEKPKTIYRVHEAIFVLRGEVEVIIYDLKGIPLYTRILRPLDICYAMDCGHGYKVLTENTKVVEFKNGPFAGDKNYDSERWLIDDPNNFYFNEQV